jgi:exonuclease V gamma subunit
MLTNKEIITFSFDLDKYQKYIQIVQDKENKKVYDYLVYEAIPRIMSERKAREIFMSLLFAQINQHRNNMIADAIVDVIIRDNQ